MSLSDLPTLGETNRTPRAQPKSALKTREQVKGRKSRSEAKVKQAVRALCVKRDGGCRIVRVGIHRVGFCAGPLEWAHLGEWKRCFTRGLTPEQRHHTRGSFIACRRHHTLYDRGAITIDYGRSGADEMLIIGRRDLARAPGRVRRD